MLLLGLDQNSIQVLTCIYLYLSCRFVCGCSCNEVDHLTVNLVLSKSENELGYTPNSCQSKLFSMTLLVINMLGKMTRWSCLMPENKVCASCHADSAFLSVLMFFLFPDKWCNVAMDGTSAINILYQYPLWSLSQSAEMTFVLFLFCHYRIWCFCIMCAYTINVSYQMLTNLHICFLCLFHRMFLCCKNLSISEKMCEHAIQCVNICWISCMAEEGGWIIVQNTFSETL